MTAQAWTSFDRANSLGDPGSQPRVTARHGQLCGGVADTQLDFLTLDALELRSCSSRGWRHRADGTQRQDSYSILVNDRYLIVAVADGVSESEQSYVAAETAARAACKLISDQLDRAGHLELVNLSRKVSMRIIEEAEYRQIAVAEGPDPSLDERLRATRSAMASTLVVAVVDRLPDHRGFGGWVGIVSGDSAAYLLRDGEFQRVGGGKDESPAITSSSVRPLPGPVEPVLIEFVLRPGDVLLAATDGIGDIIGEGVGEAARMLAGRWGEPPTIDRFLCDVNAYRRTYDDDRTAVGIWVRPDTVLPEPPPSVAAESDAAAPDIPPDAVIPGGPETVGMPHGQPAAPPTETNPESWPDGILGNPATGTPAPRPVTDQSEQKTDEPTHPTRPAEGEGPSSGRGTGGPDRLVTSARQADNMTPDELVLNAKEGPT